MQELAVEVRAERGAGNSDDEDGGARGKKVLNLLALLVQKYVLYWYKSTAEATLTTRTGARAERGCSIYLLYWYKSTNANAKGAAQGKAPRSKGAREAEEEEEDDKKKKSSSKREQQKEEAQKGKGKATGKAGGGGGGGGGGGSKEDKAGGGKAAGRGGFDFEGEIEKLVLEFLEASGDEGKVCVYVMSARYVYVTRLHALRASWRLRVCVTRLHV
jgi:hypothetical protein